MHAHGRLMATDAIRPDEASAWTPLSMVRGFSSKPALAKPDPMAFNLGSPKEIYEAVLGETDAIQQILEQPAASTALSAAISVAKDSFSQLKEKTDEELRGLDKASEWDAFTVAFYGETNAGKSTIIETLRIAMREPKKLEDQRKFLETREKFGIDADAIEKLEQKRKGVAECEAELCCAMDGFAGQLQEQEDRAQKLVLRSDQLAAEIRGLPLWRRILSFIWKIPLKAVLLGVRAEILEASLKTEQLSRQRVDTEANFRGKIDSIRRDISQTEAAIGELASHEDGAIIGDGQSDFTRHSTPYEFEVNGNRLVLLDVPGIEGKQELVREPILEAVRKAHAVFYVTRKANPPQKGDENAGGKGTLEQIKEHLGAQTEVWVIFNKSIKSPEMLLSPKLVSDGERSALSVLEAEMRKQLGRHYSGLLCLGAYPAFVASANHLIPGRAKAKDRDKFLKIVDAEAIRQKTGFQGLITKLSTEMAENGRLKIRRSNFNKANEAVLWLKGNVDLLVQEQFAPLFEKLEGEAHAATRQLDSATDALKSRLESDGNDLFDKIRNMARSEIYRRIESDIDKDEFKAALESCIRKHGQMLECELPNTVSKNVEAFKEEINGIVTQFQEHVQDLLEDMSQMATLDVSLNINIDNGVNVAGLIGSVVGGIGLFFVTGGWALAIAAFGVFVSAVKAVRSFFSSSYKKAQQRKSADENLDRVFGSVKRDYSSQLEAGSSKLEENIKELRGGFSLPALQAEKIKLSLVDSSERLSLISEKIKKEGGI